MTYEERLRAIGRLVDRHDLRDVCVMETADGAVVSGIVPLDRRTGIMAFAPRSIRLGNEAIEAAHRELGGSAGRSRGWFKRK
jgi:hypothetical protein